MTAYRYLPDGTRVEFPSEEEADAASAQCPDLKTAEAWSNALNRHHVDFYAPENPGLSSEQP